MNNYSEGARLNRENTTFENPTPPEVLDRVRVESTSILSGTLAAGVDSFAPAGVAVSKVKNEMFDDFDEDLDHVLLIERLRMLLSRRALGLMNQHVEVIHCSSVICSKKICNFKHHGWNHTQDQCP